MDWISFYGAHDLQSGHYGDKQLQLSNEDQMGKYSGPVLRQQAKDYLTAAFAFATPSPTAIRGDAVRSNGDKMMQNEFERLTGMNQEKLSKRWTWDPNYTTCGDFAIHYCNHLGIPPILLLFGDPKTRCENEGKGSAWITDSHGESPKYGDVFKSKVNHVGVSMEYEGSIWRTAEGGQGGKAVKFDMVVRKETQSLDKVQGWVDIELWDACKSSQSLPVPPWLSGFWKVYWQGQEYYYYFASDRRVRYCNLLELAATLITPGGLYGSEGRFVVNDPNTETDNAVVIRWDDGLMERFRFVAGSNPAQMYLSLYDADNNQYEDQTPSTKLEWADIPNWPYPVL